MVSAAFFARDKSTLVILSTMDGRDGSYYAGSDGRITKQDTTAD